MNLSRKTFIKSLFNVVIFTAVAPFVFAENPNDEVAAIAALEKVFEDYYHLKFNISYKDAVNDTGNRKKIFEVFTKILEDKNTITPEDMNNSLVKVYRYFGKNLDVPEIQGIYDYTVANNNGVNDKQSDGYTFYITSKETDIADKKYAELINNPEHKIFEKYVSKIPGRISAKDFDVTFDGQNQDITATPVGKTIEFDNAFSKGLMDLLSPFPNVNWQEELKKFNDRMGVYKIDRQMQRLPSLLGQKNLVTFIVNTQQIINTELKRKINFPANDLSFQQLFLEAFVQYSLISEVEISQENYGKIETYLKSNIAKIATQNPSPNLLIDLINKYTEK